jgi:mono/diheme cytochrome c family protein
MGRFVAVIVTTAAIILAAVFLLPRTGWIYVAADRGPSSIETRLANGTMHSAVDRLSQGLHNPIPVTDANLIEGVGLYRRHCALCHGGPEQPISQIGRGFYPPAPQFLSEMHRLPVRESFFITKHGVRWTGMPGWADVLTDDQIWKLSTFLSRLDDMTPAVKHEWNSPPDSSSQAASRGSNPVETPR